VHLGIKSETVFQRFESEIEISGGNCLIGAGAPHFYGFKRFLRSPNLEIFQNFLNVAPFHSRFRVILESDLSIPLKNLNMTSLGFC
jgi:hypothetical protein